MSRTQVKFRILFVVVLMLMCGSINEGDTWQAPTPAPVYIEAPFGPVDTNYDTTYDLYSSPDECDCPGK